MGSESPASLLGSDSTAIAMGSVEPDLKRTFHITIIGAGLAGLVAAIALAKSGYKVTILERDGKLHEVRRAYTTTDLAPPSLRPFGSGGQAYKSRPIAQRCFARSESWIGSEPARFNHAPTRCCPISRARRCPSKL